MKNTKYLISLLIIFLLVPAGMLYAENILIQADKQTFDGEKTTFEGKVKVNYSDIMIKSPKAIVRNDKTGKPDAATFVDGAYALKQSGYSRSEVKANIINLSLLKNRIRAEGNAESSVFENQVPIVHIKAGSQSFDIKSNIIVATDNVNIKYKEILTNSDKARITINDKGNLDKVELLGNVTVNQQKSIIKANEIHYNPTTDEMVASGNTSSDTILEDGTNVVIYADFQQYDNATQTLITSGNVKIKYKDYIASGPKATFIPEGGKTTPNKIIFLGRSKIQEGQRYVEGDRLELTVEPKNFTAEGNVKTRFTDVANYKDKDKNKKL
ncbi:MAG: hypothetical protein A2Y25_08560 [Candidatus Melainabacteria bacterium GWF2_37_15]|nr:MAG: hypothetical protein A2Y25_08560 [Candidatus Melainabacteria bacterium GWF2_37_15]